MDENQQIIKEQFSELPESLKNYIKSKIWISTIADIANNFSLKEENRTILENEVLMTLLGFNTKSEFDQTIGDKLDIDSHTANLITEMVYNNIFNNVSDELADIEIQTEEGPINTVGQSFEQIILNQARAMQPARPKDETGRIMNHESGIMGRKEEKPVNLPTGPQAQPQPSVQVPNYSTGEHKVHDYKPGADPYREPIE